MCSYAQVPTRYAASFTHAGCIGTRIGIYYVPSPKSSKNTTIWCKRVLIATRMHRGILVSTCAIGACDAINNRASTCMYESQQTKTCFCKLQRMQQTSKCSQSTNAHAHANMHNHAHWPTRRTPHQGNAQQMYTSENATSFVYAHQGKPWISKYACVPFRKEI